MISPGQPIQISAFCPGCGWELRWENLSTHEAMRGLPEGSRKVVVFCHNAGCPEHNLRFVLDRKAGVVESVIGVQK